MGWLFFLGGHFGLRFCLCSLFCFSLFGLVLLGFGLVFHVVLFFSFAVRFFPFVVFEVLCCFFCWFRAGLFCLCSCGAVVRDLAVCLGGSLSFRCLVSSGVCLVLCGVLCCC